MIRSVRLIDHHLINSVVCDFADRGGGLRAKLLLNTRQSWDGRVE